MALSRRGMSNMRMPAINEITGARLRLKDMVCAVKKKWFGELKWNCMAVNRQR